MDDRRHARLRRLLGSLAILSYLCGGPGTATGMVVELLGAGDGRPIHGACGCGEAADCCGAACCDPAPIEVLPDCCRADIPAVTMSCCADEPAAALPSTAPAPALALVARCTCGQRDHQTSLIPVHDAHLPVNAGLHLCPPPSERFGCLHHPSAATWRPEPRDRVPKTPRFSA